MFAIRPEPGLSTTISAGQKLGLDVFGEALFEIQPIPWTAPDPATVDALLIGSANAIRHGGPQLDLLLGKPVHAVGKTTAEIATAAGFQVEATGQGGLQSLLDAQKKGAASWLRYLRLSGRERVRLNVSAGIDIEERIVYQAAPLRMSAFFEKRLRSGGIVLLHSAAAARHFAEECSRLGLPKQELSLAALGPRIAAAAKGGWAEILYTNTPDDAALLALVKHMCQDH